MSYRRIDLAAWPGAKKYRFFRERLDCAFSMTADVEISDFLRETRARGLRFYSAAISVISRVVNAREYFRMSTDPDGGLIVYDTVNPVFTDALPGGDFNILQAIHTDDFSEMYARTEAQRALYRGRDVIAPGMTRNMFVVTCIPNCRFRSFELELRDPGQLCAPMVLLGKYEEAGGKLLLPVSLRVSHSVCGGVQAGEFFGDLEAAMKKAYEV